MIFDYTLRPLTCLSCPAVMSQQLYQMSCAELIVLTARCPNIRVISRTVLCVTKDALALNSELCLMLQGLFDSIPENLFRSDISSTELRNKGAGLS